MENLPADVLYQISISLAGQQVSLQDKYNNALQIINLCKVNKRFNQLYCKGDRIWKELWIKDFGSNPNEYIDPNLKSVEETNMYLKSKYRGIKEKYIKELNRLKDLSPNELLIEASSYNYLSMAKYAVGQGADVNYDPYDYPTPVNTAAMGGNLEVFKYLVGQGADIYEFEGALYYASVNNFFNIVDYMLNLKLDPDNFYTTIRNLIDEKQFYEAEYLLKKDLEKHILSSEQREELIKKLDKK